MTDHQNTGGCLKTGVQIRVFLGLKCISIDQYIQTMMTSIYITTTCMVNNECIEVFLYMDMVRNDISYVTIIMFYTIIIFKLLQTTQKLHDDTMD